MKKPTIPKLIDQQILSDDLSNGLEGTIHEAIQFLVELRDSYKDDYEELSVVRGCGYTGYTLELVGINHETDEEYKLRMESYENRIKEEARKKRQDTKVRELKEFERLKKKYETLKKKIEGYE